MVRVFTNGLGDLSSIPGRVIPKTKKMVLDAILLKTPHYKVRIKGKVEQSRERISAVPLHLGVVAIEKGAFWSPSTTVANFTSTLPIWRQYHSKLSQNKCTPVKKYCFITEKRNSKKDCMSWKLIL